MQVYARRRRHVQVSRRCVSPDHVVVSSRVSACPVDSASIPVPFPRWVRCQYTFACCTSSFSSLPLGLSLASVPTTTSVSRFLQNLVALWRRALGRFSYISPYLLCPYFSWMSLACGVGRIAGRLILPLVWLHHGHGMDFLRDLRCS